MSAVPNEPVPTIDDHVDNLLTDPWPLSDQQRARLVELLGGRPRLYRDLGCELEFREHQAARARRRDASLRLPRLDNGVRDPERPGGDAA